MSAAAAARRGTTSRTTLPSRLSLGAAIVDFHPQLWAGLISGAAHGCAYGGVSVKSMIRGERRPFQAYTRSSMAEKPPKARAKPRAGQAGVLGTLPATRPERLGSPRSRAKKP